MVPKPLQYTLGLSVVVLLIAGPWMYAEYRKEQVPNFHAVEAGILYRSGQMSLSGLKAAIHDHGIKTVVSCRSARKSGDPHPDADEEEYCYKNGIKFVRIPYKRFEEDPDGTIPADENARKFRAVMADPSNHPVLVHCFAGKHRTGTLCAIYRIEFDNWSREQAIQEMIRFGYDNIDEHKDLLGYLLNYQPGK